MTRMNAGAVGSGGKDGISRVSRSRRIGSQEREPCSDDTSRTSPIRGWFRSWSGRGCAMDLADIINVTPWTLAVGIGYAVWRGDLRLRRELEGETARCDRLDALNKELAQELKAVTAAAQQALRDEQESTRKELAELRKTNTLLVKSLTSGKDG